MVQAAWADQWGLPLQRQGERETETETERQRGEREREGREKRPDLITAALMLTHIPRYNRTKRSRTSLDFFFFTHFQNLFLPLSLYLNHCWDDGEAMRGLVSLILWPTRLWPNQIEMLKMKWPTSDPLWCAQRVYLIWFQLCWPANVKSMFVWLWYINAVFAHIIAPSVCTISPWVYGSYRSVGRLCEQKVQKRCLLQIAQMLMGVILPLYWRLFGTLL